MLAYASNWIRDSLKKEDFIHTFPVRAAFPLGATVSTYTLPFSSWFNTSPSGLISSTTVSSFPADRDERANLIKSSSFAMERAVDDVVSGEDVASNPKALTDWMHMKMAAEICRKSFIVARVCFE